MILSFGYIIYIIFSFLFLVLVYIYLQKYKKYSFELFNKFSDELITSEKYSNNKKNSSSLTSNKKKKINKIKKLFKIKSTEKTYEDIKFVSNKPNYINFNNNKNKYLDIENIINLTKIKNYNTDEIINNTTQIYLKTKQEFYDLFINSVNNKYYINNITDFELFHKNNLNCTNSNILIKFYNTDINKYSYIFVKDNKMIKIVYNSEYDNICDMIDKNNGIFMLEDINNNNFIGYGSSIQEQLNTEDLKRIFFNNDPNYKNNKNYKLLSDYKYIKIYFYICNQVI